MGFIIMAGSLVGALSVAGLIFLLLEKPRASHTRSPIKEAELPFEAAPEPPTARHG